MRILLIALGLILLPVTMQAASLTVVPDSLSYTTVPPGATRVPLLSFNLTAPCGQPVQVESIAVAIKGFVAPSTFSQITLWEAGERVGSSRTLNSRRWVNFPLRLFTVAPCQTRSLQVTGDIAANASPVAYFTTVLQQVNTGQSSPVIIKPGSKPTRAAPTIRRRPGQLTVRYLPIHRRIRAGEDRLLTRLELRAGRRAQQIEAITFTVQGSARVQDLKNLRIFARSGKPLSNLVANPTGNQLTFNLQPPLSVARSRSQQAVLRGDVLTGRGTLRFIISDPSDIKAVSARGRLAPRS